MVKGLYGKGSYKWLLSKWLLSIYRGQAINFELKIILILKV